MKQAFSLFIAFYRLLIRFYPRPFRDEFGAEMEAVFQEQLADAVTQGRLHLLQACWRELRDWPRHCLLAHWRVRQQHLAVAAATPPSWWDTAAAGLPYFLFAIIASSSALLFLFGQATGLLVSLLVSYGFVFLLLLVLIVAWWRGWPVWSAAWLGFLFFVLLVLVAPGQLFALLDQPAQILASEVGFPLLWLAVLYVLLARWPRSGLVAMLPPFGIIWLLYLEFVPENVTLLVMAATWVWLGIIAIVLLRWRRHAWDVWLLYLAGAAAGVVYVYAGHFLTEMPVRSGTLAGMGEDLLAELIPVLVPMVGVLLLHTLRWWSLVNGRTVMRSYRLFLAGVVLAIIGLQTSLITSVRFNFAWPETTTFWFTAVLLVGCLLIGAALWLLIRGLRQRSLTMGWPLWLLLGLLLLLPWLSNARWMNIAFSNQVWLAMRLAGLFWLAAAAWLVGHLRQQLPPIPAIKQKELAKAVQALSFGGKGRLTRWQIGALILALFLLVTLLLPATTLATFFPNSQAQPFDLQTSLPLFLLLTAGLVMIAMLLAAGLNRFGVGKWVTAVAFFTLCALMLAASLRNYYWLAIWDSTYDGLGILWLFIPIMGVFLSALGLMVVLPRRTKMAAFFYLLFLPPALLLVTERASHVDFYQLTESRAVQIAQALEAYHAQTGYYPDDLGQLTPRYLRSLSEPMIIFGQDWCYVSDGTQYQFGYVFRDHWSSPNLVGHVSSATNSAEDTGLTPLCEAEIAALHARDPGYYSVRND